MQTLAKKPGISQKGKKQEYERQKYETIERNRSNAVSREFYKAIRNEKRGYQPRSVPMLKSDNGDMIINEHE